MPPGGGGMGPGNGDSSTTTTTAAATEAAATTTAAPTTTTTAAPTTTTTPAPAPTTTAASASPQAPNCPPCGSSQTQLSQAEAQVQLDLHNKFRHAVHGTTDHALEWDCALMCQAQVVGDTCLFQHSNSYGSTIMAGENLATGTDGVLASWMWFSEYPAYEGAYASGVGHYTAAVWQNTGSLGCGICRSPGASPQRTIYLCQYANGPANYGGTTSFVANVPQFQGTKQQYDLAGIPEATVLGQLGMICGWVQYVPQFQSACDAKATYEASYSLLQAPVLPELGEPAHHEEMPDVAQKDFPQRK
jgi:hypothetical protein